MPFPRRALGLCLGASSIKLCELTADDASVAPRITAREVVRHDCDIRGELAELLNMYPPHDYEFVAITGRNFKRLVNLPQVTEPEAIERALREWLHKAATAGEGIGEHPTASRENAGPGTGAALPTVAAPTRQRCPSATSGRGFVADDEYVALLSLGSENFILYELGEGGTVAGVRTGNKCASGTGEFFLQQIGRMNMSVEDACRGAVEAEPYRVSGRCSVFCKSDCTHALNKGVPGERVAAGLGGMIAEKALDILGALPRKNVIAVGGVTRNAYVMSRLAESIDNLVIPEQADIFEAWGAALYALDKQTRPPAEIDLGLGVSSFGKLPPLAPAASRVAFHTQERGIARDGDECVLGLDVGSTTTKAVLLRRSDNAVLASCYLRTNGAPIRASRNCYSAILDELGDTSVHIRAVGVTGSGRYIAGLHAGTDGIINEIIAHATAAAHFDPEVDTIFEIGGQDAKYTYLVNGVPCDYAMNEACSAGTGSFLEEAAKESLDIDYRDIQDIAIAADAPPNFNDQCAAFISSDIKNASHEMSRDNIVAGLVYSICMNYTNRVKGARKVGKKVFMQGGVCYNRAVPLAMASLLERDMIVPPEPGLMGAFGVALEVKQRLELGLLEARPFDLGAMARREVSYGTSFNCPGKKEKCDRGCDINVIEIEGRKFPFGGACAKYYNQAHHKAIDTAPFDLVAQRQRTLYEIAEDAMIAPANGRGDESGGDQWHLTTIPTVGLTRSFLVNLLYPLYRRFFESLGCDVIVVDEVDPQGLARTNSSFCYPAEISHGMMASLVKRRPDYIFLPQVYELSVEKPQSCDPGHQCTCITAFAESYYLKSAFREFDGVLLTPLLNFSRGWETQAEPFIKVAQQLGFAREQGAAAYEQGVAALRELIDWRRELGRKVLAELEADPARTAVVLFGRPYNAFADEANMGIPRKFASRGVTVIPFDCLPFYDEPILDNMTWAMGQDILRCTHFVKKHPQLFGAFVTNFGCGPDSFVVTYFRDIMQTKPSLTLEIDSHTADAGVNTRIEAFLDICERFRKLGLKDAAPRPFQPARLEFTPGKPAKYVSSQGTTHDLSDPRVKVVFPSMGRTLSELCSATFRGFGIRAETVPYPSYKTLMHGRSNTSCKECLPLILTVGSLLEYMNNGRSPDELLVYFMPTANGNCRFPQYYVFFNQLAKKRNMENVVTYTLSSENSYGGLGLRRVYRMIKTVVVGDVMDDIRNAILTLAKDREQALAVFDEVFADIARCFENNARGFYPTLRRAARRLHAIPRRLELADAKKALIAGEIFVRKDEFSSQRVVEALAARDIVATRAPMIEWIHYVDYWVQYVERRKLSLYESLELKSRMVAMNHVERKCKRILARSGFYHYEESDIRGVMETGSAFVDEHFGGETILVIGQFFRNMVKHFHGMISVGPFACLPTRIVEAILTPESKLESGRLREVAGAEHLAAHSRIPFLSIESDGNPFPQIIDAQLEAFALQVERLHERTRERELAVV